MALTDQELLRRFADDRSEAAFTELVGRYAGLVHSAAARQTGDDLAAAEDATQAVFTDLARKARRLTAHTSLTGWLYTSTRYLAANARRTEQRRRQREQEAYVMDRLLQDGGPGPDWDRLRPALDDAMHDLRDADREAVLLRFFEKRTLAEIGGCLGLDENAARMRFSMMPRPDDTLVAEAVPPGTYTITALAMGEDIDGRPVVAAGGDNITFSVPEEPSSEPIDLGTVTLKVTQAFRR